MKQANILNHKSTLLALIIAVVFSSCSMVKSGDVNNFNRVKYHPHLKGVKLTKTDKVERSEATELSQGDIEKYETEKLERTVIESDLIANEASSPKLQNRKPERLKSIKLRTEKEVQHEKSKLNEFPPFLGLSGLSNWNDLMPSNGTMLATPAVDDDSAIGGLIWLLLVILLVLVILSILAELGGGVIGTLIAVLLILLILRLLGVI